MFGLNIIDKTVDEHVREIANLACDPTTLIFLDTNIIAYLYKLHDAARQEFFGWAESVIREERLVIPAWAATEYLSRVRSKNLDTYTAKSKEPSQAKKALDSLHQSASLFVDDSLLTKSSFTGDRQAYLNEFRATIDSLDKYLKVFAHQFDTGVIHQQIQDYLSSSILDSDLTALCARAASEGEARYEHRLPPGFLDGHKEENTFGDLIIWYEILEKSKNSTDKFPSVLFISNDEKSDWVYAPKLRIHAINDKRKQVNNSNPEIKIIDPRLTSEFRRNTGHSRICISNLAFLVEGLSRVSASNFSHLAAAIQVNIQEAASEAPNTKPDTGVNLEIAENEQAQQNNQPTSGAEIEHTEAAEAAEKIELAEAKPCNLQYDQDALQDKHYQADEPTEINEIIRALKSHNWYTQNPAITNIRKLASEDTTPSAWFVLGRNIYQAACGNSQKAMEFINALDSRLEYIQPDNAKHLLAGIVFEIYFDPEGDFREKPKFDYASKPLAVIKLEPYSEVLEFINSKLEPHKEKLIYLPGDQDKRHITARLSVVNNEEKEEIKLESVLLNGHELLLNISNNTPDSEWFLWTGRLTLEQIRRQISESLAIPKWALSIDSTPSIPLGTSFTLPRGRVLNPERALNLTEEA